MNKIITTLLISFSLLACSGKKEIGADMLDAKLCTRSEYLVPFIKQAALNWNEASSNYTQLSFTGVDDGDCDVRVDLVPLQHSEDDATKNVCARTDYAQGNLIQVDQDNCPHAKMETILTHEEGHLFFGNYHSPIPEDVMYWMQLDQHITDNDLAHLP